MSLTGLFDLLSVFYVLAGLRLAYTAWRRRAEVLSEPLTPAKRQLADSAAYLLAVPPSVLVHELGHAVAVWAFGGQVLEFGYRFFWGYVLPDRRFPPTQDWVVAVAGTAGSLLFGLLLWLWLGRRRVSTLRYFARRALAIQIIISLIYYPVMSRLGLFGDWLTIYDFGATPLLSGLTAVAHAGLLGVYWWGRRQGWWEMAAFRSQAEQANLVALGQQVRVGRAERATWRRYIEGLLRAGAPLTARAELRRYQAANPQEPAGYLLSAILASRGGSVPRRAREDARRALDLGLSEPWQRANALRLLSLYYQERDDRRALDYANDAVAALQGADQTSPALSHPFFHQRSRLQRRLGQYDAAYADLGQAARAADQAGAAEAAARYRDEVAVLSRHAGREFPPLPGAANPTTSGQN